MLIEGLSGCRLVYCTLALGQRLKEKSSKGNCNSGSLISWPKHLKRWIYYNAVPVREYHSFYETLDEMRQDLQICLLPSVKTEATQLLRASACSWALRAPVSHSETTALLMIGCGNGG